MLKGILCPSKISGAQFQPPSVLLNGLFTWKEQYLHIPGTRKRLPMASLVPHILASPVLPCLEREGPATPPGLSKSLGWLGPSCWSSRSRSLQVSMGPTSTGCGAAQLRVCSGVLLCFNITPNNTHKAVWKHLVCSPFGDPQISMQPHKFVTNVTAKTSCLQLWRGYHPQANCSLFVPFLSFLGKHHHLLPCV